MKLLLFVLLLRSVSPFGGTSPKRRQQPGTGFGINKSNLLTIQHVPDNSEPTSKLVSFLLRHKSVVDKGTEIGFSKNSNIRGLYATKSFKKGDIVCQIPSDLALALSDPSQGGTDAPTIAHGGLNFLNYYQKDANAGNVWDDYLNTLPTPDVHFDPTPDFYSEEEIQSLEFPRIIRQATDRKRQIRELADEVPIDFDELQFATWIVSSRSFEISISTTSEDDIDQSTTTSTTVRSSPQQSIRVLVPYIDMINHSSDNPNAELDLIDPEKDDAWFAIRAKHTIPKGKEITISYGMGVFSSVEMLMNYGFVPKPNKIDELMLTKGGDDVIANLSDWTATLQDDIKLLEEGKLDGNMKQIVEFRIKLKSSYPDKK